MAMARSLKDRIALAALGARLTSEGTDHAAVMRRVRALLATTHKHPDHGGDPALFRQLMDSKDRVLKANPKRNT